MGPFGTKEGINVDEAIASGLEASGVAPQTSVPTASTPGVPDAGNPLASPNTQTGRGGMRGPQFQGPEWAWRPVQEDFGQVQYNRDQYDTGVVPTVNVQLPFAALANRQQATAQKRAALDKKVADFDLYAGIGKAPDPYMPAFGKLARGGMNQLVQEIADAMYDGDTAQATRAIATDPELNNRWRARAAEYNELGTNGQYWFDLALAYKEAYEADPTDKDPEDYQQALRVLQGMGEFGGANGPDIESLAKAGRTFEATASRQELFNSMKPVLELAMQELQAAGTISREMGNMIGLRETNVKNYGDLIDRLSNDWYRSGIGESAEDNKKWLKARLGGSMVTSTKLQGRNWQPEYAFNAGREGAGAPAVSRIGLDDAGDAMAGSQYSAAIVPTNKTDGSPVKSATFIRAGNRAGETVRNPVLDYDTERKTFQWVGQSLTESEQRILERVEQEGLDGVGEVEKKKYEDIRKKSKTAKFDASYQKAENRRLLGYDTPEKWVASVLQKASPSYGGITDAEVKALMEDPSTREYVMSVIEQVR